MESGEFNMTQAKSEQSAFSVVSSKNQVSLENHEKHFLWIIYLIFQDNDDLFMIEGEAQASFLGCRGKYRSCILILIINYQFQEMFWKSFICLEKTCSKKICSTLIWKDQTLENHSLLLTPMLFKMGNWSYWAPSNHSKSTLTI